MKRLLTATTALALVGGAAFAEISVSGDAKFSLDYNSEPGMNKSKHEFKHEMGVDFTGSGTTDGGLSFGGKAGFDTGNDTVNTGNVWISGAFGKITVGDNDSADFLAGGIADVGVNGIGVDDIAEFTRGTTASQFRYDHSFGNIALAVSAGTGTGNPDLGVKKNDYAIGMSFSMSGATLGLGYDNYKATSLGLGYATGPISVNTLYSNIKESKQTYTATFDAGTPDDSADDITLSAKGPKLTSIGADMSYSIGASTLTLVYGQTTIGAMNVLHDADSSGAENPGDTMFNVASGKFTGAGMGFTHDLGGGAKLVAGFGKVDATSIDMLTLGAAGTAAAGKATPVPVSYEFAGSNKASIGLTFAF